MEEYEKRYINCPDDEVIKLEECSKIKARRAFGASKNAHLPRFCPRFEAKFEKLCEVSAVWMKVCTADFLNF
jgi:hypothetical protein